MIDTTIHLPDWLYDALPWLCAIMAVGYGAVDHHMVALMLT